MTDKKDGDPGAVRHLRPKNMPHHTEVNVPGGPPGDSVREPLDDLLEGESGLIEEITGQLEKLRAPFPAEEIERRPQPAYKNAWEDQPRSRCEICGGWHPIANTVHLEYVGHAGVTRRLLEVDPMWNWKPLARDENGLPLFDRFGGLWIKLTICGVTRLGYGDAVGKQAGTTAVKEIIGDAIRNAAMRFGVALELWSKIDRHEGKNPGATDGTSQGQTSRGRDGSKASGSNRARQDRGVANEGSQPRAANQDALDELLRVCDTHGYDTREVEARYNRTLGPPELVTAHPDDIRNYAAILIGEAEAGPGPEPQPGGDEPGGDQQGVAQGSGPEPGDPQDTSDVEKQPGEAF